MKNLVNLWLILSQITIISTKLVEFASHKNPNQVLSINTRYKMPMLISKSFQKSLNDYCSFAQLRKIYDNHFEIFYCGMKLCADPIGKTVTDPGLTDSGKVVRLQLDQEDTFVPDLKICFSKEHSTAFRLIILDDREYLIERDGYCLTRTINRVEFQKCTNESNQIWKLRENYKNNYDLPILSKSDRIIRLNKMLHQNEEVYRNESLKGAGRV
ncbi:hypothetical protein M153_2239000703 [Pseudoloma neurophilia]|uniref:Ricin B lectin domain-containing protein n=1 Tax=Pseudoloma neurophilia TaxID=146866 RepID=A0A0R0LTZ0_9MICR|nr:hypothetical protein M153_2239000703 [Pseudoloma neurophilia]